VWSAIPALLVSGLQTNANRTVGSNPTLSAAETVLLLSDRSKRSRDN